MTLTKPLGNNALIEVLRKDNEVSRADDTESLQFGKIVEVSIARYHLTASAYGLLKPEHLFGLKEVLKPGTIVRWEEFAEGGQTFKEDGKTYALVPWWRLISYEENQDA